MGKRKRIAAANGDGATEVVSNKKSKAKAEPVEPKAVESTASKPSATPTASEYEETVQVVAGSYDRVLHGLTATIRVKKTKGNKKTKAEVDFADTFLFIAHASAIRCVAVSPPSAPLPGHTQKVFLASGATDERINLYELSAHPPKKQEQDALSAITPRPVLENRKNKEIGSLMHHGSNITALSFPSRSKLLSSSDDSTMAVTRTRDWSVLSTIKAPVAKPHGRPSGDTAPMGGTPSGVSDFAIHPSMKLMISVSKGERSMRLWNLMTGKKAGVLNFEKGLLQEIGEGARHLSGEGRRVIWGSVEGADEFAVVFERDVVVFGMDSVPKCRLMTGIRTKVHQAAYLSLDDHDESTLLAVSTEDGRIIFFSTKDDHITEPEEGGKAALGTARMVAQIGGKEDGVNGRIKEFSIVRSEADRDMAYVTGASSDGKVRLWTVDLARLVSAMAIDSQSAERSNGKEDKEEAAAAKKAGVVSKGGTDRLVGTLAGTYETQNRITCLAAYLMIPRAEGAEDSEEEMLDEDEDEASSDEESD